MGIFIFTTLTFLSIDYEGNNIRTWMYTEYLEMYIAAGLLIYTMDFMFRQSKLVSKLVKI